MPENRYVVAVGFVQFEPRVRETNNTPLKDFVIRLPGSEGKQLRVSLWGELAKVNVSVGDFVAVEGRLRVYSYRDNAGKERRGISISAGRVAVLASHTRPPRQASSNNTSSEEHSNALDLF
ncbi:MAG: single-stranded DNA-binding protein [Halobacteria archaeon]